jgi:hypothetical protein
MGLDAGSQKRDRFLESSGFNVFLGEREKQLAVRVLAELLFEFLEVR